MPTRGIDDSGGDDDHHRDEQQYEVVYQKVVRPPPAVSRTRSGDGDDGALLFLGQLVEHLSDQFQLPDKLPMVYEAVVTHSNSGVMEDEYHNDDELEDVDPRAGDLTTSSAGRVSPISMRSNDAVVSWDSPLSPNPHATRLDVHVVGIYPSDDDAVPTWAMVAVRKRRTQQPGQQQYQPLPVLLHNLFAESEKQILRHLDRTLQDIESGRISLVEGRRQRTKRPSFQQSQQDMIDDFVMLTDQERDLLVNQGGASPAKKSNANTNAIDADVVQPSESNSNVGSDATPHASTSPAAKPNSRPRQESVSASGAAAMDGSPGLDYAIQAARSAAARRQQRLMLEQEIQQQQQLGDPTNTVPAEDFAVEAARKAITARASPEVNKSKLRSDDAINESLSDDASGSDPVLDVRSFRPPILHPDNMSKRAFATTISRPQEYSKARATKMAARESPTSSSKSAQTSPSRSSDGRTASEVDPNEATGGPAAIPSKRKLNVVVEQSDGEAATPRALRHDDDEVSYEASFADDEQVRATNQVLDELASGEGSDLTAEELLRSVMAFGDGQDEQDTAGAGGFAAGVFDTAKELLREQNLQRQQRLEEPSPSTPVQEPMFKEILSPDEEIRRMFEAGERIAEGRLAMTTAPGGLSEPSTWSAADEQLVDNLVAKEKSVSGHARVLDDELTELELQINKSPEERKGTDRGRNPVFDILSGPEVYNPNVDPETAVNWPGAIPGTRKAVNTPKELDEAIKQAQFAASVLSSVEERQQQQGGADAAVEYYVGDRVLTREQVQNLQLVVKEAVEIGLIEDPLLIVAERSRLQMLLDELRYQPGERFREIASSYKDLLLSDHFVQLVRERMNAMAERDIEALRRDDDSLDEPHAREREILGTLVGYAQLLLKETRALGAELEAQHLEVIRSICKVAMDPRYSTQEDTAQALTDAVRNMRPLFDDSFVAYLKFAVAEEEGRLARAGLLDDPDHNQWLFVLRIVQQGVYKELERGVSRYIDHIWYVLRMETPTERRLLLKKLVDVMPTMDVRPFVQVVENIVGSLGDSATGEFDGAATLGEMTNKLLQLRRDVRELLPPERIALMSRDADEWAAAQKKRLIEQRRQTQQLLEGARKTEHLDDELDALGRRGEVVERIE